MDTINLSLIESEVILDKEIKALLSREKTIHFQLKSGLDSIIEEMIAVYDLPRILDVAEGQYTYDNIVIANNRFHAQFVVLTHLLYKYNHIVFPEFISENILSRAEALGYIVSICRIDSRGFYKTTELRKLLTPATIIYLSNPSEPFGFMASSQKLSSIGKLANTKQALVLADDSWNRLLYAGKYYHIGKYCDNVVSIFSLSVFFDYTYALSYIFTNDGDSAEIMKDISLVSHGIPDIPKLEAFLFSITNSRHSEILPLMIEKRDSIACSLKKMKGLKFKVPEAGNTFMVYSSEESFDKLTDLGILVEPVYDDEDLIGFVLNFNQSLGELSRIDLRLTHAKHI